MGVISPTASGFPNLLQSFGPYTNGKNWTVRCVDVEYNYPKQVQWFGRFLQNLAKSVKVPLQTDQRRPASTTIAFWCGCLRVNISDQKLATIDEFYKKIAGRLPIRQVVRDMENIPPGFSV